MTFSRPRWLIARTTCRVLPFGGGLQHLVEERDQGSTPSIEKRLVPR